MPGSLRSYYTTTRLMGLQRCRANLRNRQKVFLGFRKTERRLAIVLATGNFMEMCERL